jgi:hypothetical protein
MHSPVEAVLPPEFPFPEHLKKESLSPPVPVVYETKEPDGMSLRAYAAIHLRIPDSGIEWLDRMIRQARKFD